MAIKKISFNKEGLVSEETIERKERKTPPPENKNGTGSKSVKPRKGSAKGTDVPKTKPVKITAVADKKDVVEPGKTLLEQDVIKFKCTRCSSERIAESKDAELKCGLCGAPMEYKR